ncbi:MAG: MFS transporter [Actinomycetes bacterium]
MSEVQVRFPQNLWNRELPEFPLARRRAALLFVIVISTITMYYQQYVASSVAPSILSHFGMSFRFYITITVVASAVGAIASLLAGLGDRFGRANIVVVGLFFASLITAFGTPSATTPGQYAGFIIALGFFEGVVLVATPALVRDFSPQVRRGTAMGFWTLGPVIASLVVSVVASSTLGFLHPWQDQFHIAGIVGLIVFVFALLALRELAPGLRDQLLYSAKERVLVEARARGIDVESATSKPYRQMLKPNIILPAIGVSAFLLLYFSAVGVFVIYFSAVFNYSQATANGIGNWFWAVDAVTVVLAGVLSDRLGVRKPLMVIGAVVAIVMSILFAGMATQPNTTSYATLVIVVCVLSAARAFAYAPWMASFTETIESRNPALVATGMSVWGWFLRIFVAGAFLILPSIVPSTSPVVNYGLHLKELQAHYGPELKAARAVDAATLKALQTTPMPAGTLAKAISEIMKAEGVTPGVAIKQLQGLKAVPASDKAFLLAHGREVLAAQKAAPQEWKRWWWFCAAGQIVFLPTIFLLVGRWSPKRARREREEHEAVIDAERERLAGGVLEPS